MNQVSISSKGVAYFATATPYIGLTWDNNGITVHPIETLDNNMLCLHVASNRKFDIPKALYNAFELGENREYLYTENADKSITIRASLRHPISALPVSDYQAVPKMPDIEAEVVEPQRCGHNLKATCLLKRAMPYVSMLSVTLALNKTHPFLMIQPADSQKKRNDYNDVEMFYGTNVELFCEGVISYNIKASEFAIPAAFARYVGVQHGDTLQAAYSFYDRMLLITPNSSNNTAELPPVVPTCSAEAETPKASPSTEVLEKIDALTKELEQCTAERNELAHQVSVLQEQLAHTKKLAYDSLLSLAKQFQDNATCSISALEQEDFCF